MKGTYVRRLPEEFEGKELAPVCLATKLHDAQAIEKSLDEAGIDYTFEITQISGQSLFSVLFGVHKKGILFLVPPEKYKDCLPLIQGTGLERLIVDR
jgi:hypothetical protein